MTGRSCEVVRISPGGGVERAATRSAEVLARGGVILCPTDTIYGLSALASDRGAVGRIYRIKGKPETKPSLVLVDSIATARRMAAIVPPLAEAVMAAFWPGPLTVVLAAAPEIDVALTAGTGRIGMRLPDDEYCVRMVRGAGQAVVSTSANRSGEGTSGRFDELLGEFGPVVDLAVDGGERAGRPSTVVDLSAGSLVILREGAVSAADLAGIAGGKP